MDRYIGHAHLGCLPATDGLCSWAATAGAAFLAMQKHLQVEPADLASHFRELGATTSQVWVEAEGPLGRCKAYEVRLLRPAKAGEEGMSLERCFPAIRAGRPTTR